MDRTLQQILRYLNKKRGFDFSGCRPSMIERRINKRVAETHTDNFGDYLDYLQEDPGELCYLLDVLTINVSGFFRDSLTFEWIENKVLPALVFEKKERAESSIRVWSTGCSTGGYRGAHIEIQKLFQESK